MERVGVAAGWVEAASGTGVTANSGVVISVISLDVALGEVNWVSADSVRTCSVTADNSVDVGNPWSEGSMDAARAGAKLASKQLTVAKANTEEAGFSELRQDFTVLLLLGNTTVASDSS